MGGEVQGTRRKSSLNLQFEKLSKIYVAGVSGHHY